MERFRDEGQYRGRVGIYLTLDVFLVSMILLLIEIDPDKQIDIYIAIMTLFGMACLAYLIWDYKKDNKKDKK